MLQDYDFKVAVSESRQIDAAGDYLYYYAGNAGGADATLRVRGLSSGMSLRLAPGQSFRLPAGQRETAWVITPNDKAQPLPIVGVLAIGAGDLTDNRITGSVEVVDGGKARTLSGVVYGARFVVSEPPAGLRWYAQFWNPVNSGKRMIVQSVIAFSSGPSGCCVGYSPTQLATVAIANIGGNKLSTGGQSGMENRYESGASFTPAGAKNLAQIPSQVVYREAEPIIITPGFGLHVCATDTDVPLTASVSFMVESL